MVFQATRWSWKRIAARALLIPVLAGASANLAHAQLFKSSAPSSPAAAAPSRTAAGPVMTGAAPGDPKALLKEGRKMLAAGHYNDAQDYARRADQSAQANGVKWGLFDDTPKALLKDVQTSVLKAQKHEAESLVKQAKVVLAKHTNSDRERAANLDTALQMARRADSLHGSYSVWEFGDRPDKMVKEIEAARARMKLPPAIAGAPGSGGVMPAVGARSPGAPSGVVPAGGIRPTNPAPLSPSSNLARPDYQRSAAFRLMNDGKQLENRGDFGGAHAKYTEALKQNARFAANERRPEDALADLNVHGSLAIKSLIDDANFRMSRKDYVKADAALNAASDIAAALNLFAQQIEAQKTALRMATNGQFGGMPPGGVSPGTNKAAPGVANVGAAAPQPGNALTQFGNNKFEPPGAVSPIEVPQIPAAGSPPANEYASSGVLTGQEMLHQASIEFMRGDYKMAADLAQKAYNLGGVKQQAISLLNSIDAAVRDSQRRSAEKSFEAAFAAFQRRDYGHALSVLVLIQPTLLAPDIQAKREELITSCNAELGKSGPGSVVRAAGGMPPDGSLQPMGANPPGTARVGDAAGVRGNPDSLASQADSLKKVEFQKLRSEGLKVQVDAQAAFGRGETDVAMHMLIDYSNRVRGAGLDSASVALLLRPIDSRMEMFKLFKGQKDATTRLNRENREAKELVAARGGAAEEQRKAEVGKLVRQYQELIKKSDFAGAERVAAQAEQLEPDDPAIGVLRKMAKTRRRVKDVNEIAVAKENIFADGLNAAEREGPLVDINDPVAFEIKRMAYNRGRGRGDDSYLKSRTPKEYEIELKLDRPLLIDYEQLPLSEVIEDLRKRTHVDFSWDTAALNAEQISTAIPITEKMGQNSLRNALHIMLDKAGLSFVIEYDTVRITTQKRAKGRLVTKVFSVADLVTPIPNFAMPEYANFDKMISSARGGGSGFYPSGGGLLPARESLGGGVPAAATSLGAPGTSPVGVGNDLKFGGGGILENNALTQSSTAVSDRGTKHEQLMKLVTGMVRPLSWDAQGGPGRIEFFDLGSALVVNQTADVIREVSDLLEALRKLQDLAVAVEVRIISLSESWFERMGVDFSMNILSNTTKFQPSLTSGQFTPEPFINDINNKGVVAGLQPSGVFTPDLNVPIKSTSFQYAVPGFGGYPNNPGNDGGVSLGLAFLNDIQVYLFMEAAQGDKRVNVMQAPKLTLFNGQTATINISDLQFFVTSVQVYSVNGQVVFIPRITPLPGPGGSAQTGNRLGLPGNVTIAVQAVVSADRRFVRINLPITMSAQSGATVPLFPITTFITPVFEGGSQGVPIPFTQFIQQPAFTAMNISTTVVCPDGGTVLLGGLKQLQEGRNEFGPPFLSNIPYVNRLFKNVGIGRDTSHIMIMVTPRIIINSEEEINQTEGAPLGAGGPGR